MNQNRSPLLRRVLAEFDRRLWREDYTEPQPARVIITFKHTKPLWWSPFAQPVPQPANDLD